MADFKRGPALISERLVTCFAVVGAPDFRYDRVQAASVFIRSISIVRRAVNCFPRLMEAEIALDSGRQEKRA